MTIDRIYKLLIDVQTHYCELGFVVSME